MRRRRHHVVADVVVVAASSSRLRRRRHHVVVVIRRRHGFLVLLLHLLLFVFFFLPHVTPEPLAHAHRRYAAHIDWLLLMHASSCLSIKLLDIAGRERASEEYKVLVSKGVARATARPAV